MTEIATPTTVINVAVIDDDANVRNGLWWLLDHVVGLRCVGTYAGCREFLNSNATPPEVLLLDVSMPEMSGLEGIRPIKTQYPSIKIIVHSNFEDEDKITHAQHDGAAGYVLKNASAPQLYDAILSVYRGDSVWPAGFEHETSNSTRFSFLKALVHKVRTAVNLR